MRFIVKTLFVFLLLFLLFTVSDTIYRIIFNKHRNFYLDEKEKVLISKNSKTELEKYKININIKTVTTKNNNYATTLNIKDSDGNPIGNTFIAIFDSISGEEKYPYSILKTNNDGYSYFVLNKGSYRFLISTDHVSTDNEKGFWTDFQFKIPNQEENVLITLNKFNVNIINLPFRMPKTKTEITAVINHHQYPSMMIGDFDDNGFYINGDGVYSINLDILDFDSNNPFTFALAATDIDVKKYNNLVFDFNKLNQFRVEMSGAKYAWFKLITTQYNTGDFQSMYFNRPTLVYTNFDILRKEMVYIPSPKCVNDYLAKDYENNSQLINNCNSSDIRYDFFNSYIYTKNNTVTFSPPTKIDLYPDSTKVKQGDKLTVGFNLSNGLNEAISGIYLHKNWDLKILPQIFIKDENGKMVFSDDLYDTGYNKYNKLVFRTVICLDPGIYDVEVNIPAITWNQSLLSNRFKLEVLKGKECSLPTKPGYPSKHYQNWKDLYSDKSLIFENSSGYIAKFPNLKKYPHDFDWENKTIINGCADIQKTSNQKTVLINITNENTGSDKANEYANCLYEFSKNNQDVTYILNNIDFNHPFSTNTLYIFYHYYSLLKQTGSTVGIMAKDFDYLFFTFSDFFVIAKPNKWQSPISFDNWLEDYKYIIQRPLIFKVDPYEI